MDGLVQYFNSLFESGMFTWVVMPILIFLARVTDVSLGTFRIIFTSRGRRYLAPLFGFIEVFIWITAMGQIIKNVNNVAAYLAYAAGFAAGNYVGMVLEDRLAIGTLLVRVIVPGSAAQLCDDLRQAGFGVTRVEARGASDRVTLVYTIVPRKSLQEVVDIIHGTHPKAFLSVEEVRSTLQGIFPPRQRAPFSFHLRKSK
jgi:uncharacterized protein YebE (UPF0316 family)